jgi:hypothetical protein
VALPFLMITSAILLLSAAAEPAPVVSATANLHFHKAALTVEEKLYAGEWAAANHFAKLLPKKTILVKWDDSKVPTASRAEFAKARDDGFKVWEDSLKTEIKLTKGKPDLLFSFQPVLRTMPGASMPLGAAHFFAEDPVEPRLETVIALKRENPGVNIHPANVTNEVSFAIGQYLGIGALNNTGTVMARIDANSVRKFQLTPTEFGSGSKNLAISDTLREAIKAKRRLVPSKPKVFLDPLKIDVGEIEQGERPEFSLQITNTGNAPLQVMLSADCTCVLKSKGALIDAGKTLVITGSFDSSQAVGKTQHRIDVVSNDIQKQIVSIPVSAHVRPLYRLIFPDGYMKVTDGATADLTAYLVINPNVNAKPTKFVVNGVPTEVKATPWSGMLADKELGEGPMQRAGYKITMNVKNAIAGRMPSTLVVTTDNPLIPRITRNFVVQRGIVPLPQQLFMGEVGKNPSQFRFIVSRPGKPFKISSVSSDLGYLKPKAISKKDGTEYDIVVSYSGKAPSGIVNGRLTIKTNDAKQPAIVVPVRGNVL